MPTETDIMLSEMSSAEALAGTSLLYVAIVDALQASGYGSRKTTAEDLSNLINNSIQYAGLNTTAKTIIGAVNELEAGGGGGGSSVSWNQIVTTGTKIAEVTIDDTQTDVYAPTSGGAAYTDVAGTLSAGSTSVTLSSAAITTSSTIDFYTDAFGVNPTNAVVTTGQVVLTFEAQQSAIGVKARVW